MVEPPVASSPSPTGSHVVRGLTWLLAGFVMPICSATYYRSAVRRRAGVAVTFFFIFALAITALITVDLYTSLRFAARYTAENYDIPEITIRGGTASIAAPQPYVLLEEPRAILIVFDTTGQVRRIPEGFAQGLLLTRTELHILNDYEYDIYPLADLQQLLGDPLIINARTVSEWLRGFTTVFTISAFFGLLLWHFLLRLMWILLIGLLIWGLASVFRPGTGFGEVLIPGLFSFVPAFYLRYLFGLAGIQFFFLLTLLHTLLWIAALVVVFGEWSFLTEQRPARLWRALLGLPMLAVFAGLMFFPTQYDAIIAWAAAGLTVLALAGVGLFGPETPQGATVEPQ